MIENRGEPVVKERRGRSNQLTKQVGEYLVACELARRGFLVATFSGNVPDFDIIATDLKGASCPIQVKTIKCGGSWQFSIDHYVDITLEGNRQIIGSKKQAPIQNLIFVFVIAADEYGGDKFYVVEWSKFQDILIAEYARYLDAHGGVRPKKPDSMHCAIGESVLQDFKNNWELIKSKLEKP